MKILPALIRHLKRRFPVIAVRKGATLGAEWITVSHKDKYIFIGLRKESFRVATSFDGSIAEIDFYDQSFISKIETFIANKFKLNP